MNKIVGLIVVVLVVGFITVFIVSSNKDNNGMNGMNKSQDTSIQAQPGENEVFIQNFAFSPSTLTIKKGTTIKWTNQDDARHDIMPDNQSEAFQASELLTTSESYEFTFNTPGTYSYHCTPHPYMKATIEVTE